MESAGACNLPPLYSLLCRSRWIRWEDLEQAPSWKEFCFRWIAVVWSRNKSLAEALRSVFSRSNQLLAGWQISRIKAVYAAVISCKCSPSVQCVHNFISLLHHQCSFLCPMLQWLILVQWIYKICHWLVTYKRLWMWDVLLFPHVDC